MPLMLEKEKNERIRRGIRPTTVETRVGRKGTMLLLSINNKSDELKFSI